MKINEVEALVGITKKNIRFYESEGLLNPRRSQNGYRDYGDAEVEMLRRIKLLRKLGLPLQEIRALQEGKLTVPDAMRRHQVVLERERENLEQSMRLCERLLEAPEHLEDLDAAAVLEDMVTLEKTGTSFQDRQKEDVRVRYVAPIVITILMSVLMLVLSLLILWSCTLETDPMPLPLGLILALLPLAVTVGVVLALVQRIREIGKGEIDDARRF